MRILYRGRKPERARYKGTCQNCGSILEAEKRELQGDTAACPVCEEQVKFTKAPIKKKREEEE